MVASTTPDRQLERGGPSRAQVVQRYSGLVRVAAVRGEPVDTPGDRQVDGCGAAVYTGSAAELGVPEGALRASMACANPVAVADLRPGDRVLDLGWGGFLGVLLSARRVGPGGHVVGVDASPDMIELARGNRVLGTHSNDNPLDREAFRTAAANFHSAFPDSLVHVERLIGEDNFVVVRWRFEGTHTVDSTRWGPASGVKLSFPSTWICHP